MSIISRLQVLSGAADAENSGYVRKLFYDAALDRGLSRSFRAYDAAVVFSCLERVFSSRNEDSGTRTDDTHGATTAARWEDSGDAQARSQDTGARRSCLCVSGQWPPLPLRCCRRQPSQDPK